MRPQQANFVTFCQQLLALGVVLAVVTPAASVVSLEVISGGAEPGDPTSRVRLSAGSGTAPAPAGRVAVPTAPVAADVSEINLLGRAVLPQERAPRSRSGLRARLSAGQVITSKPTKVDDFGTVGLTWSKTSGVSGDQVEVSVRTRTDGVWSEWSIVPSSDDHQPDAGSAEARHEVPGTDAIVVGEVDDVQAQIIARPGLAELPQGLTLAVITPGTAPAVQRERAALRPKAPAPRRAARAAAAPTMPTIYSRAQWGADESLRGSSPVRYGTVTAGFVHHTATTNGYTAEQVPGILRSIYAFHVKSRGWSDIGYNYLVDRFGRIWEGRYGGIDKAIIGAHTLGYNEYSFAMSAIGNYDQEAPSPEMIAAYAQLFGWKLSLYGVSATSTSQQVGRSVFQAINGHRDAGKTACPGQYLFDQLPTIRTMAAQVQGGATIPIPITADPSQVDSNLVGDAYPDLVVRRASDGQAMIISTGGGTTLAEARTLSGSGYKSAAQAFVSPDLTGDGLADLVVTKTNGAAKIRPGDGGGHFGAPSAVEKAFQGYGELTPVGDITGDQRADLLGRAPGSKTATIFIKSPKGRWRAKALDSKWGRYTELLAGADINGDGRADVLGRDKTGRLWWRAGLGLAQGSTGFATARKVAGDWSAYSSVIGGGDFNSDGRADVLVRWKSGAVYLRAGHGDATFGPEIGPLRNIKGLSEMSVASLVDDGAPDLVGRKGSGLVVVPGSSRYDLGAPLDTGANFAGAAQVFKAGDWDRDGFGDVITRGADGNLLLWKGDGTGKLAPAITIGTGFTNTLAPVGDMTGDGQGDLLGTDGAGIRTLYPGAGTATIGAGVPTTSAPISARLAATTDLSAYDWVISVGDLRLGDSPDLMVREKGTNYLYAFDGTAAGLGARRLMGDGLSDFDLAG